MNHPNCKCVAKPITMEDALASADVHRTRLEFLLSKLPLQSFCDIMEVEMPGEITDSSWAVSVIDRAVHCDFQQRRTEGL